MEAKSYLEAARMTDDEARAYLEAIRWPSGAACPRCGDMNVVKLQGKSTRPGVYKCRGCRKPFTVTVGTIFEDSHIPLSKWVLAFVAMCSAKKGLSALELQRKLELGSYKSAWHMAHRIRHAMRSGPLGELLRKLTGIVEIDEAHIGGKWRRGEKRTQWTKKVPIVALVERNGEARAMARRKFTGKGKFREMVRSNVERETRIMTDSAADFDGLHHDFASHETTNHLKGEYARGDVNSNTVESFFAIVKRSVHGIHHHVSERHLQRYLDERAFVWNGRLLDDSARALLALQGAEGKRLSYAATKAG